MNYYKDLIRTLRHHSLQIINPSETNSEEVDLLAMLESEGMNLKQAPDSTQQQDEPLPDLFNDIEASSNEIEDFLGMLKQESEGNSLSMDMDKNGHKSDDKPFDLS